MGRRPYFSASQPKTRAPSGRHASVRKSPSETALTSVWNSALIDRRQKTKMKKSNASSDQPAREAKKARHCAPVSSRKDSSTVHLLRVADAASCHCVQPKVESLRVDGHANR